MKKKTGPRAHKEIPTLYRTALSCLITTITQPYSVRTSLLRTAAQENMLGQVCLILYTLFRAERPKTVFLDFPMIGQVIVSLK